jgi:hypothetical protein
MLSPCVVAITLRTSAVPALIGILLHFEKQTSLIE